MSEDILGINKTLSENTVVYNDQNEGDIIEVPEKVIIEYKKLSEVEDKDKISLEGEDDTIFKFECDIENDKLVITLSEIGALCPFIYQRRLTQDKLIRYHKLFKACDDLEEVKSHITNLLEQKQIKVKKDEENNNIYLEMFVLNFYKTDSVKIPLDKFMTTEKDKMLEELYDNQKQKNKIFKKIEVYLKQTNLQEALKGIEMIKNNN